LRRIVENLLGQTLDKKGKRWKRIKNGSYKRDVKGVEDNGVEGGGQLKNNGCLRRLSNTKEVKKKGATKRNLTG